MVVESIVTESIVVASPEIDQSAMKITDSGMINAKSPRLISRIFLKTNANTSITCHPIMVTLKYPYEVWDCTKSSKKISRVVISN